MIKEDHMHQVLVRGYSQVVQREGFVPGRIHGLVRTHKCYMAVSECVDMRYVGTYVYNIRCTYVYIDVSGAHVQTLYGYTYRHTSTPSVTASGRRPGPPVIEYRS
jgi:hypothetical protein